MSLGDRPPFRSHVSSGGYAGLAAGRSLLEFATGLFRLVEVSDTGVGTIPFRFWVGSKRNHIFLGTLRRIGVESQKESRSPFWVQIPIWLFQRFQIGIHVCLAPKTTSGWGEWPQGNSDMTNTLCVCRPKASHGQSGRAIRSAVREAAALACCWPY